MCMTHKSLARDWIHKSSTSFAFFTQSSCLRHSNVSADGHKNPPNRIVHMQNNIAFAPAQKRQKQIDIFMKAIKSYVFRLPLSLSLSLLPSDNSIFLLLFLPIINDRFGGCQHEGSSICIYPHFHKCIWSSSSSSRNTNSSKSEK